MSVFQALEKVPRIFQGLEKRRVKISNAWKNHLFQFPILGKRLGKPRPPQRSDPCRLARQVKEFWS
jgi:hypothetical protein